MKKTKVADSYIPGPGPIALTTMVLCCALLMPFSFFDPVKETGSFTTPSELSEQKEREINEKVRKMNGHFTENRGQLEGEGIFFSSSREDILFLESEVQIRLQDEGQSSTVKITLEGANKVVPEGREKLPLTINYFYGSDPSSWRTGVGSYGQIVYEDLYDGIDLVYLSTGKGLKYEFHVRPFTNLDVIRIRYHGTKGVVVDGDGNLVVETDVGVFGEERPYSYQMVGGVGQEVESNYVVEDAVVSFELEEHDPSCELIIDPLIYSSYLGGAGDELAHGIAVDSEGCAYIAGGASADDLPVIEGSYSNGSGVFVAKLSPDGSELLYCSFIGGNRSDNCFGLAIDPDNNVYVTGETNSPDFPTTSMGKVENGGYDCFVFKLNATGTGLVYSSIVGGSKADRAWDIALDQERNAYVTGVTESTDFPTTPGSFDEDYNGGDEDCFISKLDHRGEELLYSSFLGGSSYEESQGIDVDSQGIAYLTGFTRSEDFPTTDGCFDGSHNGETDIFVAKMNRNGSALVYSTFLGSWDNEMGEGIAVDSQGSAYVTGFTSLSDGNLTTDFPTTPGCYDDTHGGGGAVPNDVFVTKLDPNGSSLVYSTFLGGSGIDYAKDIELDSQNCAYITGKTESLDFPTTKGSYDRRMDLDWTGLLPGDAYISKLSSDGSSLLYSTFVGGSTVEWSFGLALDLENNVYITGWTWSDDLPTNKGAVDREFGGERDVFVVRLEPVHEEPGDRFLSDEEIRVIVQASGVLLSSVLLLLAASFALSELFRFRFLQATAPHYTRLTEEKIEHDIAQQNIRGQIYRHIADNPGTCLTTIKRGVSAGYGTTVYHLSVLKREGYVRSAARGRKKLFWMKQEFPGAGEASLTETQRTILKALEEHGELSRTELLERTGIPKTTLHTTIRELERLGRLREEKRENQHFCRIR